MRRSASCAPLHREIASRQSSFQAAAPPTSTKTSAESAADAGSAFLEGLRIAQVSYRLAAISPCRATVNTIPLSLLTSHSPLTSPPLPASHSATLLGHPCMHAWARDGALGPLSSSPRCTLARAAATQEGLAAARGAGAPKEAAGNSKPRPGATPPKPASPPEFGGGKYDFLLGLTEGRCRFDFVPRGSPCILQCPSLPLPVLALFFAIRPSAVCRVLLAQPGWIAGFRGPAVATDRPTPCLFVCLCVCLVSFCAVAFPSDDAAAASARESRAGSSAPSSEVAGPSLPRASLRAAVPSPPSHTGAPPAPPSPRLSLFAMKLGLGSEADRSARGLACTHPV